MRGRSRKVWLVDQMLIEVILSAMFDRHRADMKKALARALNTWEPDPPVWLRELHDRLDQGKKKPGG